MEIKLTMINASGNQLKSVHDHCTKTVHKSPMTMTQWRRYRCKNKLAFEVESSRKSGSFKTTKEGQLTKRHVKQRSFPPIQTVDKTKEQYATQD